MKSSNMTFEIIKKEIRDVIRDKKTLLMMIIIPILLYPIMFGVLLTMEESMLNVEQSEYDKIGFAFDVDDELNSVIDELKIQKYIGNENELKEKFENEELDAYITLNDNNFTVWYTAENTNGYKTLDLAYEIIESYKKIRQSQILMDKEVQPEQFFNIYTMEEKDISNKDAYSEMMLGMVPTFILMTTTLTAVFAAIDMTAGEKERGTLETLLTFPLRNKDIIYGKFLATTICTMISSVLGFVSMYGVLYYLTGKLETFSGMEMLSVKSFGLALIIFVLYSMLISALSIMVASRAKSFKEAQNSTQPLAFVSIIPMFISMMGTKLSMTLSLIPFINVNLILNDIISNSVNMQYFALCILSNVVFIYIVLNAVIKLYKSDKILFS